MYRIISKSVIYLCFLMGLTVNMNALASEAFGRPGLPGTWASAKKIQVGSSFEENRKSPKSLVWFTNAHGKLTEVFYPSCDTAQIKDSQLLITDGKTFFAEESKDLLHDVEVLSPSLVRMNNRDPNNRYSISHTFFTLKNASVLVDEIVVDTQIDGLKFFLLTNPHMNNSGAFDEAYSRPDGFLVKEEQSEMLIQSTTGFRKTSVGFVGYSDGYQDLHKDFQMDYQFDSAERGNIATTGELDLPLKKGRYTFYVVYSFSQGGVDNSWPQMKDDYEAEKYGFHSSWDQYFKTLKRPSNMTPDQALLYYRSLYTLKVHEDKLKPGALIASLSNPWGNQHIEKPGDKVGGYHLIWPRDLYHVALALLTAGDMDSPMDALRFLKSIQYKEGSGTWDLYPRVIKKAGAFPQNTWVSGKEYWGALQLDQVGYPVHLFYHVYQSVAKDKKIALLEEFSPMLKNALKFIMTYGPWTQQERWEENFGVSPSSFSVATSALYLGAKLFSGTRFATQLTNKANDWLYNPVSNIDIWTFTTNGYFGDGEYYLRVSGGSSYNASWNPNSRSTISIANSPLRIEQSRVLDQGFLKLALLGLKPANDPKIIRSKKIVDANIKVFTPKGAGWYRYSLDAYGDDGKGRLWPLLSGEHGRFFIERYRQNDMNWGQVLSEVNPIIDSYLNFANAGLMIPEQVFEKDGKGTGAATPLAWSHAEYIKLLWSLDSKQNVENILNN